MLLILTQRIGFVKCYIIILRCIVVPDPQPPSRPLPPTPRDDPRQPHKVSTPPSNHQPLIGGGGSGGSGGQSASQRNSHVFKPMVSFYCFFYFSLFPYCNFSFRTYFMPIKYIKRVIYR